MPMSAQKPSTLNSFLPEEVPQNSMAVQQRLNVFMLEDKIQNPGEFLFRISLEGNGMDQRSGDGRFSG